jgi:guanylate kinase
VARGPLFIVSGPSGSGKSTVIGRLLEVCDRPLRMSVSATTRPPRPAERDDVAYHFWDRGHFEREVAAGAFLEWAEVHGNYYGTLRAEVEPYRERGIGVILDIDVQGFDQVRPRVPDHVSVFIAPSTFEELERRLRSRRTEDETAIQTRLNNARRELARQGDYQYQVTNDDLDTAVADLLTIVRRHFGERSDAG